MEVKILKKKKRKNKFGTRKRVEVDIVSEFEGPTQFTKAEAVQQQIPVGPKLKRKKRKKEKKTLITHTHKPTRTQPLDSIYSSRLSPCNPPG